VDDTPSTQRYNLALGVINLKLEFFPSIKSDRNHRTRWRGSGRKSYTYHHVCCSSSVK